MRVTRCELRVRSLRKEILVKLLSFAVVVVLGFADCVFARVDANAPVEKGWDSFEYSAAKDLRVLPERVWTEGGEILLKPDNLTALLLAGGASVIMRQHADQRIEEEIYEKEENRIFPEFTERSLDFLGGPGFHFGATGLWYGLAAAGKDDINRERAWTMMTALSITGAATMSLKLIVNDDTPNGKPLAWPSGHTSSSFTVASVLDEFYGPWVGIPAYIGAGAVGYRMMETGDHWPSDVVFGAVLGWIVGHGVAGKGKLEIAGFELVPYMNEFGGSGVGLVRMF